MLGRLALDADHHLSWARLDRQANLDAALAGTLDDHLPRRALAGLVDVDDTGRVLTPTALRGLLAAIRTRHTTGPPPPTRAPPDIRWRRRPKPWEASCSSGGWRCSTPLARSVRFDG